MSNKTKGIKGERERCSFVRKSIIQILDIFPREVTKEKEAEEKVVRRERGKKQDRKIRKKKPEKFYF